MSDPTTPDPQPTNKSAESAKHSKSAKKPKVKQPGRWRKRIVRTFIALVIGAFLFQILLWAILPWTLRRVAKAYDLDLTCGFPDLYLFNSDAGLWHVNVTQHGRPVASADYCRADISILNLLRGRLVIQRLEADGVNLTVQRNADGSIPLLKGLLSASPQNAAAPPPKSGKPGAIDLRPPVAIDALVLTHVRTHIVDQAVTPNLDTQVQMNFRLTDLASSDRPVKINLELVPSPFSPPLLDSVVFVAEDKKINDPNAVEAEFHVLAHSIHPKLLAGYLAPFGINVTADGLTMKGDGSIKLNVLPTAPDSVGGKIALNSMSISDDGHDALTMKSVSIDIDSLNAGSAHVGKVLLEDGSFIAGRTQAGGLRVAGLELTGESTVTSTSTPSSPSGPFDWSVGQFTVKNFKASFADAAVKPAANLEFIVKDLTLKNLVSDANQPSAVATINGDFTSPGLVSSIVLIGKCRPFAVKKTLDLTLQGTGVHPEALRPYLDPLGIRSDLEYGAFTCQTNADVSIAADGKISANARLQNIKFADGKQLVALDDIQIAGVALTPGSIHVDSIDVVGPRIAARREKSGEIVAAGFRYDPSAAKKYAETSPSPTPIASSKATTQKANAAVALATLPKIDIGRFRWNKVQVQLDDEAAPDGKAISLAIQDAGIELNGLHLDFDPKGPISSPGHVHAYLKAPGLAGDIDAQGTFTQKAGGMSVDVTVTGKNLSAILAAPYLKALNIEPTLADGSFQTKAHADVSQNGKGISATVAAEQFALNDGTTELLGADKAAIEGVFIADHLIQIGEIVLEKPRGQFARDENGAIRALGFRMLPVPPVEKKSAFAADQSGPTTQPAAQVATIAPATASPHDVFVLKKMTLRDGVFGWDDQAVKPAAKIIAHVNGDIANVIWGKPADSANFSFALKADGIVNEAKIAGTLTATDESAMAKVDISATGFQQGALVSYLPAGTNIELKDGRFHTSVEAALAQNIQGGAGGHLTVRDLDYRDGTDGPALFSLDAVNVAVPRVDIPGGVIAVDEILVTGAQTRANRSKDGTLHALGLAIALSPQSSIPPPAMQPAEASPVVAPPVVDQPSWHGGLVIAKKKYPQITVKKLDLNLRKLEFADAAREKTPPIVVSDSRFFNRKPIEMLGKNPKDSAPIDLGLTLKIDNVLDALNVTIGAAPFAGEPTVAVDITGTGLHGDGVIAQAPELADQINAKPLTDGRFHAHLFTKLKMDRFEPIDFPIDRAFDAEFLLNHVEFRSAENGPVLAGIEEVRSEKIHIQPVSHLITLHTVDATNITGQATREADGIHAMGVVIKLPASTQPASTEPNAQPASAAAAAPVAQPARDGSMEVRIDRLSVSGVDFRVTDNTVSPPLLVPINQLDLDTRNLSSKATNAPRPPTKFSLLVGAGKVPLPHRLNRNALAGVLKDTGKVLAGEKVNTTVKLEDRDLFSQIEADGEIAMYPQPKGWMKMSVSAFDLASLKSTVKQYNVDLSQGIFDTNIDIKLPGDGSMTTTSALSLTDLDLSEGANGPITRYLQLAVPFNDAKGLVEDSDGSIIIPLGITVRQGKLDGGEITGAVLNAIGAVFTRAIAAAPAKTVNAVGDTVGAVLPVPGLFGDRKPKVEEPITISFAPGDDAISPQAYAQLGDLVKRMKDEPNVEVTLRSDLSGGPRAASGEIDAMTGDIARARARANPSQEDCRELINRLSRRRDDLIRSRLDLLGQARGDVASKPPAQAAATLTRLRAIERDLAAADDALDRLYELQRPGADRQSGRRTKQAALAVGRSREDSIIALLASGGLKDIDRIKKTRPQFNPTASADDSGGKIVITVTVKKKTD